MPLVPELRPEDPELGNAGPACLECGRRFDDATALRRHRALAAGESDACIFAPQARGLNEDLRAWRRGQSPVVRTSS